MDVKAGSEDVKTYFVMRLAATGVEATALDVTTMDLQYVRSGAAPVAKVDATALAATDSAHADNKAIEIDATDQPGLYRVDWPDAAFAVGVGEVILTVKCATCFTEHLRVELSPPANMTSLAGTALTETSAGYLAAAFKKFLDVATPTGTINSLPDAVPGAAGGVFIAGSNAATSAAITGNITGNLSGSVGSVTGLTAANAARLDIALGGTYATTSATVEGGTPTYIRDNVANWTGVAVGDWVCWDTAGAKEFRRVTALDPANYKIVVSAACTPGAEKVASVGGLWKMVAGHEGLRFILNKELTEASAGRLADNFKKFLDVSNPTGDLSSLPGAVPGAAGGVFIAGANAATTVNITGNLSGSIGSIAAGGIVAASFAEDVGATAYATNRIALAAAKALVEYKLDHLLHTADNDDPADNSVIAKLAATGGDWSTFVSSTEALQALRDQGDSAWVTATGFAETEPDNTTIGSIYDLIKAEGDGDVAAILAAAEAAGTAAGAAQTAAEGAATAAGAAEAAADAAEASADEAARPADILQTPGQPIATDEDGRVSVLAEFEIDPADIVSGILNAVIGDYVTEHSLGLLLNVNLDAPISTNAETLAAIKAKTDLITAGSVTVVSPTAADGTITVTRGDDTAISLEIPNYTGPSVTGAIAIFSIGRSPKGRPAIVTITAATAAMEGTSLVLTATLAADDTDLLTANTYLYDWQLTLAGGAIYTPARGAFIVNADVSQ